jgi:hypothetical protein
MLLHQIISEKLVATPAYTEFDIRNTLFFKILRANPLLARFYTDLFRRHGANPSLIKELDASSEKNFTPDHSTNNPKSPKGSNSMAVKSNPSACTHIKVNGIRCDSPALRNEVFCYFHQRMIRGVRTPPKSRLHPIAMLEGENLPPSLVTKNIWEERFEDIRSFERHMARNGTVIRKFFLHLSKKEQKRRFLARLEEPEKNWKFSAADIHEREYWDDYQNAYQEMIRNTAAKHAPWYVIPADNKWFTHLAVSAAIVETLEELDLSYPKVDAAKRKELEAARRLLVKK